MPLSKQEPQRHSLARRSVRRLFGVTRLGPMAGALALFNLLIPLQSFGADQEHVLKHFVFFGRERQRISEGTFLANPSIRGAQLKYTWRELEPKRDQYHFQLLDKDLSFLEQHGKRLFVQLQDVSFSEENPVPDYLLTDSEFKGGAARKYEVDEANSAKVKFDGWVSRRWDPTVVARFCQLLRALGREFNGRIEGLNLAETAIGFADQDQLTPTGFTPEAYLAGIKTTMSSARSAFSRSAVIQYANFMPGEWLPSDDHGYLRAVYAYAESIGVGVGGPDLLPHRKGQCNHSYPLIAARRSIAAGIAVQDGNLEERNPTSGQQVTVAELSRFGKDQLHLDYIFWGTQEPFYSRDILPFLR